jgi:acetyltransferase-like isoleucine patch superfamily enzyme
MSVDQSSVSSASSSGEYTQRHIDAAAKNELRARVHDSRVFVGRGTYGGPRFVLYSTEDRVEIGRYCSIAECTIVGGGEHDYRTTSSFPFHWYHGDDPGSVNQDPSKVRYYNAVYKGATRIGCDVWLGFGCTILSGVTIGHGAVIGAAAVVASDVPPYAIMVGNPARCLKKRFDDPIIERLLDIRWWHWKPEHIYQYQDLLFSPPEEFFKVIDRLSSDELAAMYESDPDGLDAAYQPSVSEARGVQAANLDVDGRTREASSLKKFVRQITPPILYSALYKLTH